MAVIEIAELESILGHTFRDPRWLYQSLMHSSRLPERSAEEPAESNEKLEFLGDAVLELVVSEELVREFPDWSEGQYVRFIVDAVSDYCPQYAPTGSPRS